MIFVYILHFLGLLYITILQYTIDSIPAGNGPWFGYACVTTTISTVGKRDKLKITIMHACKVCNMHSIHILLSSSSSLHEVHC